LPLQKTGLKDANERFDHIKGHFADKEQITSYIKIDNSGVKGKNGGGESDEYHISITSSIDDAKVLPFQDGRARYNDGILKIKITREESVTDIDE
jgi:hypothetical protein